MNVGEFAKRAATRTAKAAASPQFVVGVPVLVAIWMLVTVMGTLRATSIRDRSDLALVNTKRWNVYRSFFRAGGLLTAATVAALAAVAVVAAVSAGYGKVPQLAMYAVATGLAAFAATIFTFRAVFSKRLRYLRRRVRSLERHTLGLMDLVTVRAYLAIVDTGNVPTSVACRMAAERAGTKHQERFDRALDAWRVSVGAVLAPPGDGKHAAPADVREADEALARALDEARLAVEAGKVSPEEVEALQEVRDARPDAEDLRHALRSARFTAVYMNHMLTADATYPVRDLHADLVLRTATRFRVLMSTSIYSANATLSPQLTTMDGGVLGDMDARLISETIQDVAVYNTRVYRVLSLAGDSRMRVNHIIPTLTAIALGSLAACSAVAIAVVVRARVRDADGSPAE